MLSNQPLSVGHQTERVQITMEGAHLKISVERFEECLGWYIAGSVSVPLHQLPLLQEQLASASSATGANNSPERGLPENVIALSPYLQSFSA